MVARGWSAVAVLAVAGGVVACGGGSPPPEVDPFRVCLVTTATLSGRWECSAEQALGRLASELGAEVQRRRCTPTELALTVAEIADTPGMDLIFCLGAGIESGVFVVAADHPGVRFVLFAAPSVANNVAGLDFIVEEAAYLGGVVAGTLSADGISGVIRGAGRPGLVTIEEGYASGFAMEWNDPNLIEAEGPNAPWELARQVAAVALYAADTVDPAVLAAAHDSGLLLVAVESELLEREPEVVVAALTVDVPEALVRIARELRQGTFRGTVYAFDLGSGVVDLKLGAAVPPSQQPLVQQRLDEARSDVVAGLIEIEELGI